VMCWQVVNEFRERGENFVLEVLNRPNYLEDLTGLTELLSDIQNKDLDWDDELEPSDDADF
jgi:ubiquitin-like modifier-activating enzyme ATG7